MGPDLCPLAPRRWIQSTYLLSFNELKRGLQSNFGLHQRIVFPAVSAYGFPPSLDSWINKIEKIPLLKTAGLWVFPSHLALAMKTGVEADSL